MTAGKQQKVDCQQSPTKPAGQANHEQEAAAFAHRAITFPTADPASVTRLRLDPGVPRFPTPGTPLAPAMRDHFEAALGADLSAVRVHEFPTALRGQLSPGLKAFTIGADIALAEQREIDHPPQRANLLAHELAHVVQQSGETNAALGLTPAGRGDGQSLIQADGDLHQEDVETIRLWMETRPSQPSAGSALPFTAATTERSERGAVSAVCPNCHQTPAEQREAARRRAAERQQREAEQREEARRSAWPRLHAEQHQEALAQQPGSLAEDVDASRTTTDRLRLEMFDRALQLTGAVASGSATGLSPQMRDATLRADRAASVVRALVAAHPTEAIPTEITDPLRPVFIEYYAAVSAAFRTLDTADYQVGQEFRMRLDQYSPPACPGGCHQPTDAQGGPRHWLETPSTSNIPFGSFGFPHMSPTPAAPRTPIPTPVGPRERRIEKAVTAVLAAQSAAEWRSTLDDFRWATGVTVGLVRTLLVRGGEGADILEQYDFALQLLERQQRFLDENPDALKVQAVFYPHGDVGTRIDAQGREVDFAKGIPWQFYLTRTPVPDPSRVPVGFEWVLHDLTAPQREDRTVRSRYQVTTIEALARERYDPKPILEIDPPRTLFKELDHKDFFPEGQLYWRYPLSHSTDSIETTASRTFGDWLKLIGMGVGLAASLVFAPFSTPMLIGVGIGTALSITGGVLRLREMKEHGVRTDADVHRFYWDLSLDLVSALTGGMGRVAVAAAEAGNLVRAASAARSWFLLRRVEQGMQLVNIGVATHDLVAQYRAIKAAKMSPDAERRALTELAIFALGTGALHIMALHAAATEISGTPRIVVGIDPENPGQLMARLDVAPPRRSVLDETVGLTSTQLARRPAKLRGEFEVAAMSPIRRVVQDEEYDAEVILGNGHVWLRRRLGGWCRFSSDPLCFVFGEGPSRAGAHIDSFPPTRTARQGEWSGTRGNSDFTPFNEAALRRANFQPIPYRNGYPDFSEFAEARVLLPREKLAGTTREEHFELADAQLAKQRRWLLSNGEADVARAVAFRTNPADPLTWHHIEGDNVLLLVPTPIHQAAQHIGGFALPDLP